MRQQKIKAKEYKKVEMVPEILKLESAKKKREMKIGAKTSSAWNLESLPLKISQLIRAVKTEQAGWSEEQKALGSSSVV